MTVLELGQNVTLYLADCRTVLPLLWDLDACVTDPPYELAFMSRKWDSTGVSIDPATWQAVLASLLPGAHLIGFAGTRTYHRIACAIEDSGFEIRDCTAWLYGSGFPKSLDVGKAIDKEAGAEREILSMAYRKNDRDATSIKLGRVSDEYAITAPATEDAARWQGWGTALKPAFEPACLARKPLDQKTVAKNVLAHGGCGALNIDACRIGGEQLKVRNNNVSLASSSGGIYGDAGAFVYTPNDAGRWPANLCHDGSDEVLALFPHTKSGFKTGGQYSRDTGVHEGGQRKDGVSCFADSGSAARFFYCAKVSPKERGDSKHPTMKPVALMEWLCKLVTPPGGVILDPFMGSGSTGVAAIRNGFGFVGIEQDPESFETARQRIEAELRQHNYRAVYPVKSIEEEGNIMSNLLEIAGGKDAILRASHAVSPLAVDLHSVLRLARIRFITTFAADIETRLDTAHQMHILMQGERPQAPSDEADAWDDGLISECDQVTTEALRGFDLWHGPTAERWAESLETYSVLEHEWAKGAQTLAEFIWRAKIEVKDSPAKQLSALGVTVKEIEAYWASQGPLAASAAPVTSSAPTTSGASEPGERASPLAPVAATSAAPPVSSTIKKARGRKRAHVALTLPGALFQTLRSVGVSDKVLAEASGIARSTVSRVCSGDQTEVGVSQSEFANLQAFAAAKFAEIQEVVGTLSFFEVGA